MLTRLLLIVMATVIGGCSTAPSTTGDRDRRGRKTQRAIEAFKDRDLSMAKRCDEAMEAYRAL